MIFMAQHMHDISGTRGTVENGGRSEMQAGAVFLILAIGIGVGVGITWLSLHLIMRSQQRQQADNPENNERDLRER